jgi:hypothetical protein
MSDKSKKDTTPEDIREPLTERQKEILEAYIKNDCKVRPTARLLGVSPPYIRETLATIERKGWAPWGERAVLPDTKKVVKTTVHIRDGKVQQEWVRLVPTVQAMHDYVEGLCDKVRGVASKTRKRRPRKTDSNEILYETCIYDLHLGMLAHNEETGGGDYNTDIAKKRLEQATEYLFRRAHRPKVVRLIFGGDQLHADNFAGVTPSSGHALDVSARLSRVVDRLIAVSYDVVQEACAVGDHVEIVIVKGNHDPVSSMWLAKLLEAAYWGCENVSVLNTNREHHCYKWGDCLTSYAHGDRIAANKWAQIIATEFHPIWGSTTWRYLRLGHYHKAKEIAPVVVDNATGILVTYLMSLAASDAWHAHSGYIGSTRGMAAFELDKKAGQVSHYTYNVV